MSDNSSSSLLPTDQEYLLQAALSTAFSTADIPLVIPESPKAQPSEQIETTETQPASDTTEASPKDAQDEWKGEYESHLSKWHRESALQREKAAGTRNEWGGRRAQGDVPVESDEFLGAHLAKVQNRAEAGWEKVGDEKTGEGVEGSFSPIDSRDLVTGEAQGRHSTQFLQTVLPGADPSPSASTSTIQPGSSEHPEDHHHSHTRSPSNSSTNKWDSFPSSLTSSYPSLSFPNSSPQAKSSSEPLHPHEPDSPSRHRHPDDSHQHPKPPASLSVFDSSLSTKTRVIALLGSLTINLVLPFLNGVMLGFGEIFSENVLFHYFGWRKTLGRTSVGNVGLRK